MEIKPKIITWYHLFCNIGEYGFNLDLWQDLDQYLQDKKSELEIQELDFAYYLDHFHILFNIKGSANPSLTVKKMTKAISWFLTASEVEPVELTKDYTLITVSPDQAKEIHSYLEKHVDNHLQKKLIKEIERSASQWNKKSETNR